MAAFLVDYENVFEHAVLAGTDYEERTSEIIRYMSDHKSAPRRELYTGSLHIFGRIDGMAIYRLLKDVV